MGFSEAYENVSQFEGGYVNNPKDRGGPTKYGITEEVARANGYTGDMKDLPRDTAKNMAKVQYWDMIKGDDISEFSQAIAHELFEIGFNCGVSTAARFLQRSLNVFNRERRDYGDIKVDGVVGPVTVLTLKVFLKKRGAQGELVLLRAINCLQGEYYVNITENREQDEEFVFGWYLNRIAI